MHSIMWASRPSVVYWNAATLRCLETVRDLQADGVPVFFTIDAGPQVKAVCLPEGAARVEAALRATEGVRNITTPGLGAGARLEADSGPLPVRPARTSWPAKTRCWGAPPPCAWPSTGAHVRG